MNEIAYQCTSDRLAKLIESETSKTKKEIAALLGFHQSYISIMLNKNHWKKCPAHIWNRILQWINTDMKITPFAEKYPYLNKPGDVWTSDGEASDAIEKIKDQPDLTEATEVSEKTVDTESKPVIPDNILILIERLNSVDIKISQGEEIAIELAKSIEQNIADIKELVERYNLIRDKVKPQIAQLTERVAKLEEENIPAVKNTVIPGEWQLCPKCVGRGNISTYSISSGASVVSCDLCGGAKVIQRPMINQ